VASILEGALAQTIGKAMAGTFYAATVTRLTPGAGPSHDPGEPTETDYTCKAIVDTYKAWERVGTTIQANDRKVLVLATSLDIVPKPGDTVTIRGATYTVVDVGSDPALATYKLQVRT
jgi:hypothetical protein